MGLCWLIETITDTEQANRLAESVKKCGYNYEVVKLAYAWNAEDFYEKFGIDGNVIAQCSIPTARQINRFPLYPGVFCNFNAYACSQYWPLFEDGLLLNDGYIMLPLGSILHQKGNIEGWYGEYDYPYWKLFMRPNSGFKQFPGYAFPFPDLKKELNDLLQRPGVESETLVVLNDSKTIKREWRLFATKNGVITGSQYKEGEELVADPNVPKEVIEFGEQVVKRGYFPDPLVSIDIAEANKYLSTSPLHLLEIGAFSTSGIYGADTDILVDAASKLAIEHYDDIME